MRVLLASEAVMAEGAMPAPPSAEMLLERVGRQRDRQALVVLFRDFGPKVKAMLLKQGATEALAEDIVQETFLTAWRKATQFDAKKGAAASWLYTIARNRRIDILRRHSSRPYEDVMEIDLASDAPDGQALLERDQIVARVKAAIADLPPDQAEVVRLSFIDEIPHSEIAAQIGIPLGTVKSRLRLAYQRLRPVLEDLQ